MKIKFCVLCLSYGGAEKNLCILANELVKRGHEVSICNLNHLPTVQALDDSICIKDAPKYRLRGVKRFQQLFFILRDCIKDRPDVLISFLFIPNLLTPIVGKILKIPTIISERGDPTKRSSAIQSFYNFANGIVFQTDGAKRCYRKSLQNKGIVIPNPVIANPVNYDYQRANDSIAFSARFDVQQKRQDLMVESFEIVHAIHPEYKLYFYGDGPDENRIKDLVKEKKLENHVFFCGLSRNIINDISKSRVFVLASDYEGIPNALIEAMALGMPCVSTDCTPGGARLLIQNEENGLLVPCNNKELLSAAIIRMIDNKDFAQKCGLNAKLISEKFSLKKIIDLWEEYIVNISGR